MNISAGTFTVVFWAIDRELFHRSNASPTVQSQMQKGIAAAESIFAVLDTEVEN